MILWIYLTVLGCAMLPVLELRGALPLALFVHHMPLIWAYPLCVIGNLLPVPFILLFINKIFEWMKGKKFLGKIADFFETRALKRQGKVQKYETFGLFLFVAIPLPMTGAWTGALVASLLKLNFRKSMLSIALGVLCAGVIVSVICLFFRQLLPYIGLGKYA